MPYNILDYIIDPLPPPELPFRSLSGVHLALHSWCPPRAPSPRGRREQKPILKTVGPFVFTPWFQLGWCFFENLFFVRTGAAVYCVYAILARPIFVRRLCGPSCSGVLMMRACTGTGVYGRTDGGFASGAAEMCVPLVVLLPAACCCCRFLTCGFICAPC